MPEARTPGPQPASADCCDPSPPAPRPPQGRTLSGMMGQYLALVEGAGKLSAYKDAELVALLQAG